jgi:acyl dehydratase
VTSPTRVRFDDIETLREHVSQKFGEWGPEVEVTQAIIDRFADLTNDHQWIHVDVERAKHGPFGTTIAHGFLLIALMPRYRAPLPIDVVGETTRVNYGAESYRFLSPVPAGSTIRAHARLADVRAHAQGTLLVNEHVVWVRGRDRPALTYTRLLLHKA